MHFGIFVSKHVMFFGKLWTVFSLLVYLLPDRLGLICLSYHSLYLSGFYVILRCGRIFYFLVMITKLLLLIRARVQLLF